MRNQTSRRLTHPRHPYLFHLAVGLVFGIGVDAYVSSDELGWLFVLAYLLGVSFSISLLLTKKTTWAWLLIGISLGALRAASFDDTARQEDEISGQLDGWLSSEEVELEGCVVRGSRPTRLGQTLIFEVNRWRPRAGRWFSVTGRVRVWWEDELRPVSGDCLWMTGEIRRMMPQSHPYELTGNREDIRAVLFASRSELIDGMRHQGSWILPFLGDLERIRIDREEALMPLVSARIYGWFLALGTGSRSLLNIEDRETMIVAGVAHLLAISGLHLCLVVLTVRLFFEKLLSLLCWPLLRLPLRIYGAIVTFLVSWGFAFFTGMSTSVLRAALYFSHLCFAQIFHQRGSHVGALAFAVAVSAFVEPSQVMGASLQLSVLGVIGLIASGALGGSFKESPRLRLNRTLSARFVRLFFASTGAALATYPLTAYHFGVISISGLLTNVFIAPVMAPLLVFSSLMALFFADSVSEVSVLLGQVAEIGLDYILGFLSFVAFLAQDLWITGRPSMLEILGWYGGCFLLWLGLLRPFWRKSGWRISLAACVLVTVLSCFLRLSPPKNLEIYFIPVGQGDATLVQFPTGTNLLIDTGGYMGNELAATRIIIPFLRGLGIQRLDWLLLTHGDRDHRAGLEAIHEQFSPRLFWWNGEVQALLENTLYDVLLESILSRSETVDRGTPSVDVGGAVVSVLHPPHTPGQYLSQLSGNDNSVVLSIQYEGRTVLLMGDAEKQSESIILAQPLSRNIDILKVGHHGSRTSSQPALLSHLYPSDGVFSSGPGNRYGFPHPDVVDEFLRFGIQTHNTAENGLIRAIVSEEGVNIERYRD